MIILCAIITATNSHRPLVAGDDSGVRIVLPAPVRGANVAGANGKAAADCLWSHSATSALDARTTPVH